MISFKSPLLITTKFNLKNRSTTTLGNAKVDIIVHILSADETYSPSLWVTGFGTIYVKSIIQQLFTSDMRLKAFQSASFQPGPTRVNNLLDS